MDSIEEELTQHIKDSICNYNHGVRLDELHHELFNTDYYIIGTCKAEEWLESHGTFECIDLVKTYENDNFGEVNTDFSDPEKIVNMVVYIVGEDIIYEILRPWSDADITYTTTAICNAIYRRL